MSAPASPLRIASTAEASSTILLTFRCLSPFRNQFVNQRCTRFYVLPDQALSALNTPFQSRDAKFVIFDAQYDFIADINPHGFTKRSRDDNPPVLIDPGSSFLF